MMGAMNVLPAAPITVLIVGEVAKSLSRTVSSPLVLHPEQIKALERTTAPNEDQPAPIHMAITSLQSL
jgi:hypothetical protein